jgi:hypothetical protein
MRHNVTIMHLLSYPVAFMDFHLTLLLRTHLAD